MKESRHGRPHVLCFHLYSVQNEQTYRDKAETWLVLAKGRWKEEWGVTVNGSRVAFGSEENI